MLEILSHKPTGTHQPHKLLFVHGICVGGWIWDKHVLPYFAAAGYECHAVSLRGHGKSSGHETLATHSLSDYTEDVATAAATIGGPLIVIGHSLGGAVVQNWLRSGGVAAGAALLASVPPWGLASSAVRMGFTNPVLFQELAKMVTFGVEAINPDIIRTGLFSEDFPATDYAEFASLVQNESRVVSTELQGLRTFAPMPWQTTPLLVLGGGTDQLIPPDEVWKTAAYYGTQSVIIENLAHTLMLDTRWESAASAVKNWLTTLKT